MKMAVHALVFFLGISTFSRADDGSAFRDGYGSMSRQAREQAVEFGEGMACSESFREEFNKANLGKTLSEQKKFLAGYCRSLAQSDQLGPIGPTQKTGVTYSEKYWKVYKMGYSEHYRAICISAAETVMNKALAYQTAKKKCDDRNSVASRVGKRVDALIVENNKKPETTGELKPAAVKP